MMAEAAIDDAILVHRTWVARFQGAIKGINNEKFNLSTVHDDQACAFGGWLRTSEAQAALGPVDHLKLRVIHKGFHKAAADVAGGINAQRPREQLGEALAQVDVWSRQMIELLMEAKGRIRLVAGGQRG